jgi:hypothetical protein
MSDLRNQYEEVIDIVEENIRIAHEKANEEFWSSDMTVTAALRLLIQRQAAAYETIARHLRNLVGTEEE